MFVIGMRSRDQVSLPALCLVFVLVTIKFQMCQDSTATLKSSYELIPAISDI